MRVGTRATRADRKCTCSPTCVIRGVRARECVRVCVRFYVRFEPFTHLEGRTCHVIQAEGVWEGAHENCENLPE